MSKWHNRINELGKKRYMYVAMRNHPMFWNVYRTVSLVYLLSKLYASNGDDL